MSKLWWMLGLGLVVVAVVVCLLPTRELPRSFEVNDKISHLIGHGGLAVYFAGLVARRRWWIIFVGLLLLGGLIEFAQHAMALGRQGDARDVIANALGALLGLLLGWVGLSRWPQWAARLLGRRAA